MCVFPPTGGQNARVSSNLTETLKHNRLLSLWSKSSGECILHRVLADACACTWSVLKLLRIAREVNCIMRGKLYYVSVALACAFSVHSPGEPVSVIRQTIASLMRLAVNNLLCS